MEFYESILTAVTVSAGSDHEQLEPSSRKQEDAWGLNVPQRPDYGRQRTQHYILNTRILPQPVSVRLFSRVQVKLSYLARL